jgi:tight adherence protein B
MPYLWPLLFIVMLGLVMLAISLGLRLLEAERKKRVGAILRAVQTSPYWREQTATVVRAQPRIAVPQRLAQSQHFRRLELWIRQAGLDWEPGQVLLWALLLAVAGALLGTKLRILMFTLPSVVGMAALMGSLPFLYLWRKRATRLAQFEKQFPEALDFLARAMRAGHAFAASLEMLSKETAPPLGPEFRIVYDEQNLGAPLEVALRRLAERVPLLDVRFFVSAVLLQRQTGGNLAEILRNLARVIRERFQLKGQVRAMSAHGRITAAVLTVLPILTMLGLMLLAPDYLRFMARDPHGKYLILAAVLGQITGYYLMRRITNIRI